MRHILLFALFTAMATDASAKVFSQGIYGEDHRREPFEIEDESLKSFAHSSVALISEENILQDGLVYRLSAQTYAKEYQLCPGERFGDQQTPAYCSGVLVGKDLVLTAGHCVENLAACEKTKFIFGYTMQDHKKFPREVPADNVFGCKEIMAREEHNDMNPEAGVDYALIKLDRPTKGRSIVAMEETGGPRHGDALFAFGYPGGLPLKFVVNGTVRSPGKSLFQTNLDTYGGNSGSPVMNHSTKKLEGILIRGDHDFEYTSAHCYVSKRCADDGCEGEWVMKTDEILTRIRKAGFL